MSSSWRDIEPDVTGYFSILNYKTNINYKNFIKATAKYDDSDVTLYLNAKTDSGESIYKKFTLNRKAEPVDPDPTTPTEPGTTIPTTPDTTPNCYCKDSIPDSLNIKQKYEGYVVF